MYTQSAGSMFALECRDNSVAHVSTISKQKQSIEPVPPSSAHTDRMIRSFILLCIPISFFLIDIATHKNTFSFQCNDEPCRFVCIALLTEKFYGVEKTTISNSLLEKNRVTAIYLQYFDNANHPQIPVNVVGTLLHNLYTE